MVTLAAAVADVGWVPDDSADCAAEVAQQHVGSAECGAAAATGNGCGAVSPRSSGAAGAGAGDGALDGSAAAAAAAAATLSSVCVQDGVWTTLQAGECTTPSLSGFSVTVECPSHTLRRCWVVWLLNDVIDCVVL